MTSVDPDLLRSFLAIVDTGSYGAAAEQVHKTQSTVSAQIKRLEEILGCGLFEKSGRRNVLSPDGERLVEFARAIVGLNDETVAAFRPKPLAGRITVGTGDDYAQAFLPAILGRFARTHQDIEVEVVTDRSQRIRQEIEDGTFDVGIMSARPGEPRFEVLRRDRLHWIGSDRIRTETRTPLPLALWPDGCPWRSMALAALAIARRDWRVAHTTSNAPLLTAAVREGLGVTAAPDWYLGPGLRILPELDAACPLGEVEIGLKLGPDAGSPSVETFLDYLRTALRGEAVAA